MENKVEKELQKKDIDVAEVLLKIFEEQKENNRVMITYSKLLERLEGNNYLTDVKFYIKELGVHLGNISRICHDVLNLPFISAIVVSENDLKPKEGFNNMLKGYGIKDKEKIKEEILKAQKHKDWSKLKKYLEQY